MHGFIKYFVSFILLILTMYTNCAYPKNLESESNWYSKIVTDYWNDYYNENIDELHLASYFVEDLLPFVDDFIKSKSRYPTFTLELVLDAPVVIKNNRTFNSIKCDSKNIKADKCLVIRGTSYLDEKLEVYLGFTKSSRGLLINHVIKNKPEKGSSFEWSK